MSVSWLVPAALFGLGLIAVPIAIHLLVRQQSRRVEYPSLRFLRQSQLAAFRRRRVQDGLLLACRVAIVAAAVLALAGPVLQTAARSAGYADRVARAVVLEPGVPATVAAEAAGDAFSSRVFTRDRVTDALIEATRWLDAQPPAAREMVLAGEFRRGSVSPAQLDTIPSEVGIRFVKLPMSAPPPREGQWPILRSGPGGLVLDQRQVLIGDDETRVAPGATTPAASDTVRVLAAAADQPLASAALQAALAAGLQWSDSTQRVLVAWEGAEQAVVQKQLNGATLVTMERPTHGNAATAVASAIEGVTAVPLDTAEPITIGGEQLEAWSRPPGPVPDAARPVDEGDRRWLWALALAWIAVEHWLRRARSDAAAGAAGEARVA